jgi:membrane fusion protein (multidrug efflux system)
MRPGADDQLEWVEGELMFSDISVDESTESVTMRAKFDNSDVVLLPGMYVRAELIEGVLEGAILVPQKCVMRDTRNEPQILVLRPEGTEGTFKVEARTITLGREYNNNWIVVAGLGENELLIVDGTQKARPGQIVKGSNIADKPLPLSGTQG